MSDTSPSQPDDRIAEALEGINASLRGLTRRPGVSVFANTETADRDPFSDYDRLDRKQPKRLGWMTFFRNWPDLLEAFKQVPHQAVDYSGAEPVVDCPCSPPRKVEAPLMRLVDCADCHRSYFGLGVRVLVAYRSEDPD